MVDNYDVVEISGVVDNFGDNECDKQLDGNSRIEIVLGETQMRPKLTNYHSHVFEKG